LEKTNALFLQQYLNHFNMKKFLLSSLFAVAGIITAMASGHTVTATGTNVTCNGTCNGTLSATASGGVGPYGYAWSNGSFFSAPGANLTGVCAGTYTVMATDSSDMSTATAVYTITAPPALVVSLPGYYYVCSGGAVTLNAAPSGGTPGYTYNWTPNYAISTISIANPVSAPPTTMTYTVTIGDANGCYATGTTTVYVDNIAVTVSSTNASGCGACDGSAAIMPTGGSAPYTYSWSNGTTTATPLNLCEGSYTVTATDIMGCSATATAGVTAPGLYANFTMVPDSTNGLNYWAYNTTAGTGLVYAWDFGDGVTSSLASPTHTYAGPGTYTVTLTATGSSACSSTTSHVVTVNATAATCLSLFNVGDDPSNSDPNALTVYNLSYGASLSYSWVFGDGGTSTQQNPTHVYSGMGPYQICLTVDNGSGCTQMYCDSIMSVDSLSRSNSLSFSVIDVPFPATTTGIAEHDVKAGISVYPNPFTDNTTFVIQSDKMNEVYSFELTDVLGKKVRSVYGISQKQFSISREDLQNGIYFYKIYNAQGTIGIGKITVR
jgi:PKD repeat protein